MGIELFAYADESGTQETASHCLIGGWIGSARQWKLFKENWSRTLDDYSVLEFHSNPFFTRESNPSRSNPYINWGKSRAEEFLESLTNAIGQRRLYPIGGAVNVESFLSYPEGHRRYFTSAHVTVRGTPTQITGAPTRPYQLAFPIFLTEAAQAGTRDTTVHFVFDQNQNEATYARQVFANMQKGQRHELWEKLGGITFSDSRKEPGLQAADLYAHLWYSFLEYGVAGMGEERRSAWRRLKKRRDYMRVADKGFFETLLSTLSDAQRIKLGGSHS